MIQWEKRFRDSGVAGLAEGQRSGRKPSLPEEIKAQIISEATRPPAGRGRWSVRSMARAKGVSVATVYKLWNSNDIKLHLVRTFKLSHDPQFEAKFRAVIGLYIDPPVQVLVLCCDEPQIARPTSLNRSGQKSQRQLLESTQPGLPPGIGHIRTRTHD